MTLEPVRDASGLVDWDATRAKTRDAYRDAPADAMGNPADLTAFTQIWNQEHERDVIARMQAADAAAAEFEQPPVALAPAPVQPSSGEPTPGLNVAEWHPDPGRAYVVDEALARSSPCTRIDLGEERYLVYSKGIVGNLSQEQIATYCAAGYTEKVATETERTRLLATVEASHACSLSSLDVPPAEQLPVYYTCLGQELRKAGVEP